MLIHAPRDLLPPELQLTKTNGWKHIKAINKWNDANFSCWTWPWHFGTNGRTTNGMPGPRSSSPRHLVPIANQMLCFIGSFIVQTFKAPDYGRLEGNSNLLRENLLNAIVRLSRNVQNVSRTKSSAELILEDDGAHPTSCWHLEISWVTS